MDNNTRSDISRFSYKGKMYETTPGTMDRVKESFQTDDDRAQLEAIRKARQAAISNGVAR